MTKAYKLPYPLSGEQAPDGKIWEKLQSRDLSMNQSDANLEAFCTTINMLLEEMKKFEKFYVIPPREEYESFSDIWVLRNETAAEHAGRLQRRSAAKHARKTQLDNKRLNEIKELQRLKRKYERS